MFIMRNILFIFLFLITFSSQAIVHDDIEPSEPISFVPIGVGDITIFIPVRSSDLPEEPVNDIPSNLGGIDSDNDGVRDDVELWIVDNFPDDRSTRSFLYHYSYYVRQFMLSAGNQTALQNNTIEMLKSDACLPNNSDALARLESKHMDSSERLIAFYEYKKILFSDDINIGEYGCVLNTSEAQLASDIESGKLTLASKPNFDVSFGAGENVLEVSKADGDKKLIVYANGMMTGITDAIKNYRALRNVVFPVYPNMEYRIAYNEHEAGMDQITEVLAHAIRQEEGVSVSRSLEEANYALRRPIDYGVQRLANFLIEYSTEDQYANDLDVSIHMNNVYLPKVTEQYKVIIVAHSQGNFYANRAWHTINNLSQDGEKIAKAIGVIGLATPANHVANDPTNTNYLSSENDWLINRVRNNTLPTIRPLDYNITIPYNSADPLGHGMSEIYLADTFSRGRLITMINNTFDRLEVYEGTPAIECGTSYNATGGDEGIDILYDIGESDGVVEWNFDAFNIPDELTIYRQSDGAVKSHSNYGSGYREGVFYWNSEDDGTLVRIKVWENPHEPNTQWNIMVGCPGDNVNIQKQVSFNFVNLTGNRWQCDFDLYHNQAYIGRVSAGYDYGSWSSTQWVTPGQHVYEYRNKYCECQFGNCQGSIYAYIYNSGKKHTMRTPSTFNGGVVDID